MAIADYDMLQNKDKIIIAVSGGNDSLSLLRLMQYRQQFVPIEYEIKAVHIDMGMPDFPLQELKQYFKQEQLSYHIEKIDMLKGQEWNDITCFWCAWNRRKALFQLARKWGFNKVALGHHMDDIVETMLLNLFYQGEISTMKPKQELFKGQLTLIRPMAFVEEHALKKLALKDNVPTFDHFQCPNNDTSQRAEMKKLIQQLKKKNPSVKINIFRSLERIKTDYLLNKKDVT